MTTDASGGRVPHELAVRYSIGAARFHGTTSTLYDGHDPATGAPVLVKVLRAEILPTAPERLRVRREIQKLVQVQHSALVPVLDAGESEDLLWVVRPYIPGQSLATA